VTSPGAAPLSVREAYSRWAPTYDEESVLLKLDDLAVSRLAPRGAAKILDAGCGTGHRVPVKSGIGIDLVPKMLAAGRGKRRGVRLAAANLLALPFGPGAFDLVWCRLSLGYVANLHAAYTELARVSTGGGFVLVTDLHPEATQRGHERGFQDGEGSWRRVESILHDARAHEEAAKDAGLQVDERIDLRVGEEARAFFEKAGEARRYERLEGLAVLLGYRFKKEGPISSGR